MDDELFGRGQQAVSKDMMRGLLCIARVGREESSGPAGFYKFGSTDADVGLSMAAKDAAFPLFFPGFLAFRMSLAQRLRFEWKERTMPESKFESESRCKPRPKVCI